MLEMQLFMLGTERSKLERLLDDSRYWYRVARTASEREEEAQTIEALYYEIDYIEWLIEALLNDWYENQY